MTYIKKEGLSFATVEFTRLWTTLDQYFIWHRKGWVETYID